MNSYDYELTAEVSFSEYLIALALNTLGRKIDGVYGNVPINPIVRSTLKI